MPEIGERRLVGCFWKSPGTQFIVSKRHPVRSSLISDFLQGRKDGRREGEAENPVPFAFISLHFASLMKGGEYELSAFSHRYWENRA